MLDNEIIKKIEDFVYVKPRSVQEISQHIKKNWRTADRYIDRIEKDFGTISTRIFRQGTRGALKIVYASQVEKISYSVFQEELEKQIFLGKKKDDFSAFDIFQFVSENKKRIESYVGDDETASGRLKLFGEVLANTKKQVLFFSGNLSFVNFDDGNVSLFKILEELVKRKISIKIIGRIDISGIKNVEKVLSLNHKYGGEYVEVRHRQQPLRVTIIDGKLISLKEIKEPTGRKEELKERKFIYYTINDKEWVDWMSRIFWKMFNSSIGSEKRLKELERIKKA